MMLKREIATAHRPLIMYQNQPTGLVKGLVYIAHGMGEHAARYEPVMARFAEAGFLAVANDHRGHGPSANLGDFGREGWAGIVADTRTILDHLVEDHPNLPLILMGHSMGAMLVQQFFHNLPDQVAGILLSGSPGKMPNIVSAIFQKIIAFERWRTSGGSSPVVDYLIFGSSNRGFKTAKNATGFEWLSRDQAVVNAYFADPLCGFVPNTASLSGLFQAEAEHWDLAPDAKLKAMPIYLVSGADDPVHSDQQNLSRLIDWLTTAGATLDIDIYPNGRHEMLNEINRDQVVNQIITWMNKVIS